MKFEDMSLPLQTRLRTIEILIDHYGYINRAVFCSLFGLGEAQVSKDIADYNKLNPDATFYNRKSKRLEKLSNFKNIFS